MVTTINADTTQSKTGYWWLHWFNGLREAIGTISLFSFLFWVVIFFMVANDSLYLQNDEKGKLGNFAFELTKIILGYTAFFWALSSVITLLCFWRYKLFFRCFLFSQILLLVVAAVICIRIYYYFQSILS